MKLKRYLLLNSKRIALIIVVFIVSVVIHNIFYALSGIEDILFFLLAVLVIPIYFLVALLYSFRATLLKINGNKKIARSAGILIITAYGVLVSEVVQSGLVVLVLDFISGLSVAGIAILIYPYFKKNNKQLSKGYLYLKLAEGLIMIVGGILFFMGFEATRSILYEGIHLWTFILGGFVFYYLLYKSQLVPKFISIWGLIAISMLLVKTILELLGTENILIETMLILIIANEIFLALWLIKKGFNSVKNLH